MARKQYMHQEHELHRLAFHDNIPMAQDWAESGLEEEGKTGLNRLITLVHRARRSTQ